MFDSVKARTTWMPGILLGALFLAKPGSALPAPTLEMGEAESYCVVYCYMRVPFSVKDNGPGQRIGRVFCDFDVDVTAVLPVYKGEAKTKNMQASTIGVFKTQDGVGRGDAEMNTGIIKSYFISGKAKSVRCHF